MRGTFPRTGSLREEKKPHAKENRRLQPFDAFLLVASLVRRLHHGPALLYERPAVGHCASRYRCQTRHPCENLFGHLQAGRIFTDHVGDGQTGRATRKQLAPPGSGELLQGVHDLGEIGEGKHGLFGGKVLREMAANRMDRAECRRSGFSGIEAPGWKPGRPKGQTGPGGCADAAMAQGQDQTSAAAFNHNAG